MVIETEPSEFSVISNKSGYGPEAKNRLIPEALSLDLSSPVSPTDKVERPQSVA